MFQGSVFGFRADEDRGVMESRGDEVQVAAA